MTRTHFLTVDSERVQFMSDGVHIHTKLGTWRKVQRCQIYEDVVEMYQDDLSGVLEEYPFRVKFEGEIAIDVGGVCRDMFSCFWLAAYLNHFDGERLLVPAVNPGMDMSIVTTLGTVISHGFLVSGFLPVRVAFPVLASVLLGPTTSIPDFINIESLLDYVAAHDCSVLRTALSQRTFPPHVTSQLIALLSRFECRQVPTKDNIENLVSSVARHHFLGKPLGVLYALHNGLPKPHKIFWSQFSVEKLFSLYKAMNATASSVLALLAEPEFENQAEARVYDYFKTYIGNIGNCKEEELRSLLRFVTGSSAIVDKSILVRFNNLSGLARRPISHTCSCTLDLSTTYKTYLEFENELQLVLSNDLSYAMHAL